MTLLQTAKAQLEANPKTAILSQEITSVRVNKQYGSLLCYQHGQHVITLVEGVLIWRGGIKQSGDKSMQH